MVRILPLASLIMEATYTHREENVDELVTRVFQPDTLVPYEYFTTSQRSIPLEPEKHLMHAILEDAINCFQKSSAVGDIVGADF